MFDRREKDTTGNGGVRSNEEIKSMLSLLQSEIKRDNVMMILSTTERREVSRDIISLEGVLRGKKPTTKETRLWITGIQSALDLYRR